MPPESRAARRLLRGASIVAVVAFASTGAGELTAQDTSADSIVRPTPANVAAWRDHILPDQAERRWETIPWLPTFGEGLRTASARGRPLLLYAMNGHPLGCT